MYSRVFKSEFNILVKASPEELSSGLPGKIAQGIIKVRERQVSLQPGYDGEYGVVKVFDKLGEDKKDNQQMTLF